MKVFLAFLALVGLFFAVDSMLMPTQSAMHQIYAAARGGAGAIVFTLCVCTIGVLIRQEDAVEEYRRNRRCRRQNEAGQPWTSSSCLACFSAASGLPRG